MRTGIYKGRDLILISQIKRDGSGVIEVTDEMINEENDTNFELTYLSISNKTFIASEFNSYVVKLKI